MFKRLTVISSLIALGLILNGCTKCGWIWDDWRSQQSCRDGVPK